MPAPTPSRREAILSYMATALAGTTGVSSRIYRSRVEAFSRDEAPAIVIEPAGDDPQSYSTCKIDWRMTALVAIYTRGATADQLADPIAVDVHSRLMADRSLGALAVDIMPGPVDWQRDKADLTSLWMVCPYVIRYRTAADSLTTS